MDLASATESLRHKVGTPGGLDTHLEFDCGDERGGSIDAAAGFMTGRFEAARDMSVALKLQRVR